MNWPFKKATETHWAALVLNQTLKYVLILPSRPWCNAAHQVKTTVTTNNSAAVLSHSSTAARWEEAGRRIFRLDSQNQAATFHHFTRTQQQSLWKTVKCERAREREACSATYDQNVTGRWGCLFSALVNRRLGYGSDRFTDLINVIQLLFPGRWVHKYFILTSQKMKFLMLFFTWVSHQTSFSFWTIYLEVKLFGK